MIKRDDSLMQRSFRHSFTLDDCRAEIVIKWSAPETIAQDRWEEATAEADKLLADVWKRTHDIVGKLRD